MFKASIPPPAAKVDRRADAMARLEAGLTTLCSAKTWQDYLEVQARFHGYSFNNTLLLLMQCPEASRVAGYSTWKSLGRNVRRGESALWIFAPSMRKRKIEPGQADQGADARDSEASKMVAYFVAVPVFDVAQTEGQELPQLPPLPWDMPEADDNGLSTALLAVAREMDFTVEPMTAEQIEAETGGGALGFCQHSTRRIVYLAGLEGLPLARVLAHELAHGLADGGLGRLAEHCDRELRAESVAYLVLSHYGLDAGAQSSFNYIAGWQARHGKDASKRLAELGRTVQGVANSIISALDGLPALPAAVKVDASAVAA